MNGARRRVVLGAAGLLLTSRALSQGRIWDPLFVPHDRAGVGVPSDQMGIVFGSIAFEAPPGTELAMSVHLEPPGDGTRRFEVFATDTRAHKHWRAPDESSANERLWVFSGQVPAGRYDIVRVAVSGGADRNAHWFNFRRAIPIVVAAGGTVYIGRWELTPDPEHAREPKVEFPGSPVVLRDSFTADLPVFDRARKRLGIPFESGPVENLLPEIFERAGVRT